jgi:hypothetical protein
MVVKMPLQMIPREVTCRIEHSSWVVAPTYKNNNHIEKNRKILLFHTIHLASWSLFRCTLQNVKAGGSEETTVQLYRRLRKKKSEPIQQIRSSEILSMRNTLKSSDLLLWK